MRRLLNGIWNSITTLKNVLGNLLFLAITIIALIALFSRTDQILIPETAALVIDPTGAIVEQRRAIDPIAEFMGGDEEESETLLRDLTEAIKTASTDQRIKILVLQLDGMRDVSMSQLQTLGAALNDFSASGKEIYAFADSYSQDQYYLAAHADHLYLNDQSLQVFGGVFLTGLGVYPTYFKAAIDKLKIQVHVFKVGTYKGAVEPFLRNDMSVAAQEANLGWIQVLWDEYLDQIARLRGIDKTKLNQYIDHYPELLANTGSDAGMLAVEQGLVDQLMSRQQWRDELQDLVGSDERDFQQIDFRNYLLAAEIPIPTLNPGTDKIAVIIAKGTIYDGEQPAGSIGSDSVSALIKQAREDDRVKALVMRIDSPGGSATAAEQIRYELELTQQAGKPVVASMATYAASGGYWISATANQILASPTTITGSIGTFLLFPTFNQSLAEIGVYSDGIGTNVLSGALNPLQSLNPALQQILDLAINNTYRQFISLVARGRDMTPAAVDRVAQGRVWAGTTALDLGLIDAIGGLEDAIDSAATLAGLNEFETLYLEKQLSPKERLLSELLKGGTDVAARVIDTKSLTLVTQFRSEFDDLLRMSQEPGIYLQCLVCRPQ
ncbi:signal peptide peptidase SppA [Pseudomonadales bacterium]|nr:signal peptide peptidase SppA [Pseudomonadales bacterium]MDC0174952.1 signal peptide peptidase SppA [Pseudomonadales bacterium]MDC1308249.1 signal peptide peptidase SppA [Pseudomonadales bacterium]